MKRSQAAGAVVAVVAIVWSLASFWWWAVAGMNERVQAASTATAVALGLIALVLVVP